jgi:hypothetical protein
MPHAEFCRWLQGVRVLLIERPEASERALWMIEAGATVTRLCAWDEIGQLAVARYVAVVELALPGVSEVLDHLAPGCGLVLVANEASFAAAKLADRKQAAIVLEDAPRVDFRFEVQRSAQLQVPDIDYMVGRAARLWKLPPQQTRVLFYNLWSQSDREIARAIGISVHTVQEHQNGLRRRTGVRTKHGYLRGLAEAAGMRAPLEDE